MTQLEQQTKAPQRMVAAPQQIPSDQVEQCWDPDAQPHGAGRRQHHPPRPQKIPPGQLLSAGRNRAAQNTNPRWIRCQGSVTAVFPKKTKCKPICMLGSNFMHIVSNKCIQKQYHVRKREIIRVRFILETNAPTSQTVDWGLRTPSTSNIFTRLQSGFLFLSNIVYSKGEHLSYSASVGKV
jgi:hypothetical protein